MSVPSRYGAPLFSWKNDLCCFTASSIAFLASSLLSVFCVSVCATRTISSGLSCGCFACTCCNIFLAMICCACLLNASSSIFSSDDALRTMPPIISGMRKRTNKYAFL